MSKGWTIGPDGWVTGNMFGFPIERFEIRRPDGLPYLILDEDSQLGNLHTSEGTDLDSLLNWMNFHDPPDKYRFAGNWAVGENRIAQTRPLWAQGSLLLGGSATNQPMRMEVEQVAKSQFGPNTWVPAAETFMPMAALAAFYFLEFDVPLQTPLAGWQDNGSDVNPTFFGPNNRRVAAQNNGLHNLKGWIHHCEVPLNVHGDCGTYSRATLFAVAQDFVDSLNPPGGDDLTPDQEKRLIRAETAAEYAFGFMRGLALALGLDPPESLDDVPEPAEKGWGEATGKRVAEALKAAEA